MLTSAEEFERLVGPHRRELHAHCYRMLGSVHDADDALQETLLGAWRGLEGFEGRSSLRSWLYTIATHAALRVNERRAHAPLETRLEPYPDEGLRYEDRERVELAYIAALQLLPATQRAALLLCEVLGFSAREAAEALDTSPAAVNSALQRARATLARERPQPSQQQTLRALGDERSRALVARFTDAWSRADVPAIVALLSEDARLTMPPLPTVVTGRADIAAFLTTQVFAAKTWRFTITSANGQPALLGLREGGRVLTVLTFDGEEISALTAFLR